MSWSNLKVKFAPKKAPAVAYTTSTVERRLAKRTPAYYERFVIREIFVPEVQRFGWEDDGHFFLAQSKDSHRTLHMAPVKITSPIKFVSYRLQNSTGTFLAWVKMLSNEFSTEFKSKEHLRFLETAHLPLP